MSEAPVKAQVTHKPNAVQIAPKPTRPESKWDIRIPFFSLGEVEFDAVSDEAFVESRRRGSV